MADAVTHRKNIGPTAPGAEGIGVMRVWDDAMGKEVRIDRVGTLGHPAVYLPLCALGGVSGGSPVWLPFVGSGVAQGGSLGDLILPADMPDVPIDGLIVTLIKGPGAGQWRRVIDYDHAERRLVPNREWAIAPESTTHVRLLIPTWLRAELMLRGEYSPGATGLAAVRSIAFSYPGRPNAQGETGLGAPLAPSKPNPDGVAVSMANLGLVVEPASNAGWHAAAARTVPTRGGIGMAFLVQPPTSGGFYPEACAV